MTKTQRRFNGFSPETTKYLKGLRSNNNKAWFEAHRRDYEEHLLNPLKELVTDLGEFMLSIDSGFNVKPAVNRTISRPHRDTRFSKDKSPYKTTMWISFMRSKKEWQSAPAYFFEIAPDSYRFGMGFYAAGSDTMKRFRELVDKAPKAFMKAVSFYSKDQTFRLEGDMYKRTFDETKPDEINNWYQRKNFYLVHKVKGVSRLYNKGLVDDLKRGYSLTIPLYNYLWKVKELQEAL